MKKVIALFILCSIGFSNTEAQLLKKLKDKAQKALETKTPETNSNTNTNTNSNSNGNSKTNTTPAVNNADTKNDKKQWVPTPDCQVVFTLEAGEEFFYDETDVFIKDNKMSSTFVIKNKKGEYFTIEDGKRTGPFKEAPAVTVKKTEAEEEEGQSDNNNESIEMGADKKDPVAIQYSKTINGKLFIVFNGKNFGPYDYVNKMIVSPDKKQFFAVVTIGGANAMTAKMGMGNIFMVNEAILKQPVGSGSNSMPTKFKVSNGFKHCMVTVMETSSQKMLSVTSAGKKQEADMSEMYTSNNNNTILNDNGDIISIPSQSPTQIFLNGEEVASFKVPIKSMSRLFLLPDIKKSVYYANGKLYRADGSEEPLVNILFPKLLIINKEAAIYYYKLYKNDKGTYDVYICKKIL